MIAAGPASPRIVLVYNPTAGASPFARGRLTVPLPPALLARPHPPEPEPAWVQDARAYLHVLTGAPPRAVAPVSYEDAVRTAREAALAGAELVVAAGGDGTLRAVAEGLAGTDTALGVLPRGTVNVFARELGIPLLDTHAALDICANGETRRVDMGRVADRHFLLMASVGFDALAVGNVNADLKDVVGAPAYALSALASFATFTPPTLTVTLGDGSAPPIHRGPTFLCVIANTASYGGDFRIAPEARTDDGLLDVYLFEAPDGPPALQSAAFLRHVGEIALGTHLHNPLARYLRASRVRIDSEPASAVQADGDPLGSAGSLTVEAVPGALRVRVPGPA